MTKSTATKGEKYGMCFMGIVLFFFIVYYLWGSIYLSNYQKEHHENQTKQEDSKT